MRALYLGMETIPGKNHCRHIMADYAGPYAEDAQTYFGTIVFFATRA